MGIAVGAACRGGPSDRGAPACRMVEEEVLRHRGWQRRAVREEHKAARRARGGGTC